MKPKSLVIWGLTSLTSTTLAALLAYLMRWRSAIAAPIPFLSGLAGFFMIVIILLAHGLVKLRRGKSPNLITNPLLLAGFFLLLQLAYLPISQALHQKQVNQAQAYAEALIPKIEAYKTQHGTYPETLRAILPKQAALPALLKLHGVVALPYNNRHFYFRSGSTYAFQFYYPDGFIGYTYKYCCGPHGHWAVTD
jgi:hypothetical protein